MSSLGKTLLAFALLEAEGFEDMLDIVQDELPVDVIEVGGELIEL